MANATQGSRGGPAFLLPAVAIDSVEEYLAAGGGRGLQTALARGEEWTLAELVSSGLRGRGGAGFPTGAKWTSVRNSGGTHFVVANCAEGEPATFKDRTLIRRDPYRVVEGAAIAAFVVGAGAIYLATKRTYRREVEALTRAALELSRTGLLQELTINVVEGPDEYLYGEEKAMLEVIEGRDPLPRLLPPYQLGLFATTPAGGWEAEARSLSGRIESNPTVVNNAETLATAAHVIADGAEWFRSMGTAESPGTVLATVVGDVRHPGVQEVELGTTLSALLDRCGGPLPGRTFKAAFSGVSNPVLRAEDFETPLTYEHFAAKGSGLGAAGFAIYDDSTNIAIVAHEYSRFLAVESCGQCPPCKQGSLSITALLANIVNGTPDDAVLGTLTARLRSVTDANRCFLGTEEQQVVSSVLRLFPDDVAALLEHRNAHERLVQVPLVHDITDSGTVVYDTRHAQKQPDWTYRDA